MRSFYIDPATHDLAFDNLKRLKMIEGTEEDIQAIWIELSINLHEWFLNYYECGVPWVEMLDQQSSLERYRAEIIIAMLRTERIQKIESLEFERQERELIISFVATLKSGIQINKTLKVVV